MNKVYNDVLQILKSPTIKQNYLYTFLILSRQKLDKHIEELFKKYLRITHNYDSEYEFSLNKDGKGKNLPSVCFNITISDNTPINKDNPKQLLYTAPYLFWYILFYSVNANFENGIKHLPTNNFKDFQLNILYFIKCKHLDKKYVYKNNRKFSLETFQYPQGVFNEPIIV